MKAAAIKIKLFGEDTVTGKALEETILMTRDDFSKAMDEFTKKQKLYLNWEDRSKGRHVWACFYEFKYM